MSAVDYRNVVLVTAAIGLLLLGLFYGNRWLEVDRCLDAGGRFDYETRQCDFEERSQVDSRNAPTVVMTSGL